MLIDLATAAKLVERHERVVRSWILTAILNVRREDIQIDTDDLLQCRRITEEDAERIRAYVAEHDPKSESEVPPKDDAETTLKVELRPDQWEIIHRTLAIYADTYTEFKAIIAALHGGDQSAFWQQWEQEGEVEYTRFWRNSGQQ